MTAAKAFTLIELLVVISIIARLIALPLPPPSAMRQVGESVPCVCPVKRRPRGV